MPCSRAHSAAADRFLTQAVRDVGPPYSWAVPTAPPFANGTRAADNLQLVTQPDRHLDGPGPARP
ncbi:hypothetical protein JOF34_002029 [Microbacterium amylolyticum]|uniref:Uncharacterized protein n=1 Tax=Microbacterium amylolyticum TaxID=936337 RepID=A0ABS4ZJH2_9MICO|nr:hypothetical protein [Microbacterium amylolyticum]